MEAQAWIRGAAIGGALAAFFLTRKRWLRRPRRVRPHGSRRGLVDSPLSMEFLKARGATNIVSTFCLRYSPSDHPAFDPLTEEAVRMPAAG